MIVPVIETERLILRPLRAGDEPRFLALASDWDVACMNSDIPHPLTSAQAKAWLTDSGDDVRFAIDHSGTMIGSVGYFQRRSGTAEVGFWLGRDHWGFGFGTEATKAVLRYGLGQGHRSFSSAHFLDNYPSQKLLAKLGFEAVGRGPIWCAARGMEVEAISVLLNYERAQAVVGPVDSPASAPPAARWHGRLGRWLGGQPRRTNV
ncbi:MAG: GNAT family N-acetyltransferase [Hyphomicrobiaceae bacterium]